MSTETGPRHRVIITEAKFQFVGGVPVPVGREVVVKETDLDGVEDPEVGEADEEAEIVEQPLTRNR